MYEKSASLLFAEDRLQIMALFVNLTASALVVPKSKNREEEPENSAITTDTSKGPA